jgi:hypothetical protein
MITDLERREARMARRLWELGKGDVFAGITEPGVVKQRIRAAILGDHVGQNIGHVVMFRKENGEHITLQQAFEVTYGEPLIAKAAA